MKLSLIVPCYNEAENVAAFQDAVIEAFNGCNYDYELIFVSDGSVDKTYAEILKAAERFSARGVIWPLFYTGAFFLLFCGLLTVLFGYIERKLDYYKG